MRKKYQSKRKHRHSYKRRNHSYKKHNHSYKRRKAYRRKKDIIPIPNSLFIKPNKSRSQKVLINQPQSSGNIIKGLRDIFNNI